MAARSRPARNTAREQGARGLQAANGNGLVRAQVAGVQRARLLGAMVDIACERGAGNVTVAHVVERSGVSRRTFYEVFNDRDECFLAAFEHALTHAQERVVPAYQEANGWRGRVRAGLIALLAFLDEQPSLGRVLVSESLAGGPRVLERRQEIVAVLTRIVDQGRNESKNASDLPPLTSEGVVGGALAVIQSRLADGSHDQLIELVNPLMSSIVLPFLGAAAARRELARDVAAPLPAAKSHGHLSNDPFKEAGMRLTYRTVRVLLAVADHPGASNRVIGETAGISDQGQISKLLSRLTRIGLVSNSGLGFGTGAPNAWTLTAKGEEMAGAVRVHANENLK